MRRLPKVVLAGAAVLILSAGLPVLAQDKKVKINVANNFPNSLPIVGDAGPRYGERVRRVSGGSIDMKFRTVI